MIDDKNVKDLLMDALTYFVIAENVGDHLLLAITWEHTCVSYCSRRKC